MLLGSPTAPAGVAMHTIGVAQRVSEINENHLQPPAASTVCCCSCECYAWVRLYVSYALTAAPRPHVASALQNPTPCFQIVFKRRAVSLPLQAPSRFAAAGVILRRGAATSYIAVLLQRRCGSLGIHSCMQQLSVTTPDTHAAQPAGAGAGGGVWGVCVWVAEAQRTTPLPPPHRCACAPRSTSKLPSSVQSVVGRACGVTGGGRRTLG